MSYQSETARARFSKFERIGSGGFGEVFRGWDHDRNHEVALKTINLDDTADDIEAIQKEVAVLSACRNENIVRYYAAVLPRGSMELTIAMELLPASAVDLMAVERRPLDEMAIAWILHGTVNALVYLHGQARMHRDLKAANILLAADSTVKLSDFGVAGALSGTLGFQRATFVGTPYWMAPEVIKAAEQGSYGFPADIWSLGVIAMELAMGAPPHADLHPMRALFLIPNCAPPRLPADEHHSPSLVSFVEACLQVDPKLRPSAVELARHPFIATATLPDELPALVADAAHMCSRAAQRAASQQAQDPGESAQYEDSKPEWVYGSVTPSPGPPNAQGLSLPTAQQLPVRLSDSLSDNGYNASFRVYNNAAATGSSDDESAAIGGGVRSSSSPQPAAAAANQPSAQYTTPTAGQPLQQSAHSRHQQHTATQSARSADSECSSGGGSSTSVLLQPAPIIARRQADSGAQGPPFMRHPSDSTPSSSQPVSASSSAGHKPLSGWATPRDRHGGDPTLRPGSGSGHTTKKHSSHSSQQIRPLPSLADDAAQVLQSLQLDDSRTAPFAEAALQLFGSAGTGVDRETLSDLGPLGSALLSQIRRDVEPRVQSSN